jgi:uncharacterized Rmd1/YagE family protein
MATSHALVAHAFEQNFTLRDLARAYPGAQVTPLEIGVDVDGGGWLFLFPFGAAVFCDVEEELRKRELDRLRAAHPTLTKQVVIEELAITEDAASEIGLRGGALTIDRLSRDRAGVCALAIGQSAAMEYYERIVDALQVRTTVLVDQLAAKGTVPRRTRPLHKLVGEAIGVRSEVLTVLHLLDKPDATWDDPAMDAIYRDLRAELDLADRFDALEAKVRLVQESLELVLDVARDFRAVSLEVAVVVLILFEVVMGLVKH